MQKENNLWELINEDFNFVGENMFKIIKCPIYCLEFPQLLIKGFQ